MASVFDVAAYIQEGRGSLARMKLLKLVYYAHAWSLVWEGRGLLSDDTIEAWPNGPVPRALWIELQHGRGDKGDATALSASDRATIDEVVRCYGRFSGDQLSDLTHEEPPWRLARADLPASTSSRNPVTDASMRDYYGSLAVPPKQLTNDLVRGIELLLSMPPDERGSLFEASDADADAFIDDLANA